MNNVVHLDEYRVKKDLKKVQNAMVTARTLIANGIKIPNNIINRLQEIMTKLEKQLETLCEDSEKNTQKKNEN
jgi:tRNA(Phe) wybutosine-synthesizing methylase Tyw3